MSISDSQGQSKLKKIFGFLFPVILMFLLLYFAFRNTDFNEVLKIIKHISVFWLLVFIIIWFLSHVFRAYRWKVLIHSVKPDTSLINLLGATFVGYTVNLVVPRLGELYRPLFLGRWEDISRSSMIGTIIVERVIDVLVLGISVLISVVIYPGNLLEEFEWLKTTIVLGFAGIFAIIFFLILLVKLKHKFYDVILKLVGKFSKGLAAKLTRIFDLLTEGFSTLKTPKDFALTMILSVVIMLLYASTSYFAFYMMRMNEIQEVTFAMAWIVMSISAFGIIIPTPGSIGSYHLITISVLTVLFGFDNDISSAFAIVTHLVNSVMFVVVTVILSTIINKRQIRNGMPTTNFLSAFKMKEIKE